MAARTLLISKLLRRRRPLSFSSLHYLSSNPHSISPLPTTLFFLHRSLSTHGSDPHPTNGEDNLSSLGFGSGYGSSFIDDLPMVRVCGEEPILPVGVLISLLDWYHDFTGFPWWVVIGSSTLALRIALLPMIVLQLRKLKQIAEFMPKLPPPLPPPLSGRSYIDQLSLFRKERQALGCPSLLWFLAAFTVQAPCFILGMMTIRRMSLEHHPGFEYGGTLWFQNLTEYPHGTLGFVIPSLVACLHLLNVQVGFQNLSSRKASGLFNLFVKYYKVYLQILTAPILFAAINVPQGSLVYWVTNSSLSLIQQLSLNNPSVRVKLGLPEKAGTALPAKSDEIVTPEVKEIPLIEEQSSVHVENLSPKELLALSIKHLAAGEKEEAIPLLRSALDKDPDYTRALIVMGQILMQNGQLVEAIEYLERAISKLFLIGIPTEVEETDLLILASQWAGVAYIKQEKNEEGIRHLERVANLKEPEDSKSKAHYYDAFVLLGSALYREGHKGEAAKYLRAAAAYNPAYQEYLNECEKEGDDFASDLARTRRRDY